jgi:hypothetical protein
VCIGVRGSQESRSITGAPSETGYVPGKGSDGQGQRCPRPHAPNPDSQGPELSGHVQGDNQRAGSASSRLPGTHPPSAPAFDALSPLLAPRLLSVLPHRLLPGSLATTSLSAFPLALHPRPPSCLLVLALLRRCFLADCPWGKGEGSLANSGRSQVEAAGRGKEASLPSLH